MYQQDRRARRRSRAALRASAWSRDGRAHRRGRRSPRSPSSASCSTTRSSYARDFMPRQQVFALRRRCGRGSAGPATTGRADTARAAPTCCARSRAALHARPRRASRRTRSCSGCCEQRAADGARRAAASTGAAPRCSPSARCCSRARRVRLTGQDSRPRHLQPPPRRAARRRDRRSATCRSPTSRADQGRFCVFDSMLSEAGRARLRVRLQLGRPAQRSCSGRRSSATSPTARRSIIDQFIAVGRDRSGSARAASCCCCRTATRARGRSTRARASSASCSSAPRTTCRSCNLTTPGAVLPRCCAARCTARSASRWSS